jgi:hypothetical protein
MDRITNENETVFRPGWQGFHIVKSPDPNFLTGMGDNLLHTGTKLVETLHQHIAGAELTII